MKHLISALALAGFSALSAVPAHATSHGITSEQVIEDIIAKVPIP